MPSSCLARVCVENPNIKPLQLSSGNILCPHVTITTSRMLLEGPYATQSNPVIRRYQEPNPVVPASVECSQRVEFCNKDSDRVANCWDREVNGSWFVQRQVGRVLCNGFALAGRSFEFLHIHIVHCMKMLCGSSHNSRIPLRGVSARRASVHDSAIVPCSTLISLSFYSSSSYRDSSLLLNHFPLPLTSEPASRCIRN